MRVASKLGAAFTVLLILLGAAISYQIQTTRRVVSNAFAIPRIFTRLELTTSDQLEELDRMEEMASKLAVTGDYRYRAGLDDAYRAFDATLRLGNALPSAAAERVQRGKLIELWIPVASDVVALEAATATRSSTAEARLDTLLQRVQALRVQSRRVAAASRGVIRARLARSDADSREAERFSIGIAGAALLISVLVAFWIVRSIARPLGRLRQGTKVIAEGRFDYRLETDRDDEFAELARDFNRMTERLAELDRVKRDFVSGVSHDLKTPLASMQETNRILLDGVTGELSQKQRRLLELSLESGQRLSGMIGKILESARTEGGGGPERERRDLRELVRRSMQLATPALLERQVALRSDLAPEPVEIECDADRMLRVVDNLLENAAKFSPPGGAVRVGVRTAYTLPRGTPAADRQRLAPHVTGGVALLTVEDEGPGVRDQEKERIFERFYQAAGARKVRNHGVGLGLAICRQTVDEHGGAIWVEDAEPRGSRFVVALPHAAAPVAPEAIRR